MANKKDIKKKKIKEKKEETSRWHDGLKEETKYAALAIVCLAASFFLILSMFGKAGLVGSYIHSGLILLLGRGMFLAPALLFCAAITFFSSFRLHPHILATNFVGAVLILVSSLSLAETIFGDKSGGYIGFLAAFPFLKLVDFWATLILFFAILIIGILVMFNIPISFSFLKRKPKQKSLFADEEDAVLDQPVELEVGVANNMESEDTQNPNESADNYAYDKNETMNNEIFETGDDQNKKMSMKLFGKNKQYQAPPLELLDPDKGKPSGGDIKANSNIIKRTFQNFGINVEMDEVCVGPSVAQYCIKPAEGVKLSRIVGLNNDLALALAAHPIRIEAPIPGKSLVGIEVPNRASSMVGLRHLLKDSQKQKGNPLLLALGRNVAGRAVYSSICKMPHLLIAGATGSGKSVSIHSLMMNLLYRHTPLELQFILIDPKRVELNVYNNLPHLLCPVITEAKKAIMALKWAAKEMERRYEVLLKAGVRDIHSYHTQKPEENMPFIVVVVDELADIMATYPREFEAAIVRLAQMSRAVGIHLVVSTQRPSVEVITGLIKSNIPTRIAFQVPSQVDSRTILDMAGAEKLLGNGDMLFLSSDSAKPRRVQGSFVSEKEVKKVVDYLINYYDDLDLDEINIGSGEVKQASIFDGGMEEGEEDDELYEEARELVVQAEKASSSYLQRRLRVGYARAARLLDMLEERGVVGPPDGSKPRDVLIDRPESDY